MRIFNVVVVWDVYAVAMSAEAALEAIQQTIKGDPDFLSSTQTSILVGTEKAIRNAWLTEKPIVGADISDADFESLKGKTTQDVYAMLYTKPPANTDKPTEKSTDKPTPAKPSSVPKKAK